MVIYDQELADVFFRGELADAGCVVLFKINTCVLFPLTVSSDRVLFL